MLDYSRVHSSHAVYLVSIIQPPTKMTRNQRIESALKQQFNPTVLIIDDESHMHHVPENSESHFKITLVSEQFARLTAVQRHRLVTRYLKEEFTLGLHALSLQLFTPQEWQDRGCSTLPSPTCLDGFNNE